MALIKCPECGKENVSDKAEMCPQCGFGIKAHFEKIENEKVYEQERKKRYEEEKKIIEEKLKDEIVPCKPSIERNIAITWIILGPAIFYGICVQSYICVLIFLALGIGISSLTYRNEVEKYNRAKEEFDKNIKNVTFREIDEEMKKSVILRCPVCQSIKVQRISTANRMASFLLVGMGSAKIGKQYKCESCGHMW